MLNHRLKVNGHWVSYVHEGQEHDPRETRLFLHGFGLRKEAFKKLVHELAKEYPVIALDLPGHGKSHKHHFWGYEAYAQFVADFLDALNIQSVHLMGQSMGGGIALTTAALFPERVKSVVVMNSSGVPMRSGHPSIAERFRELWVQGFEPKIWSAFITNALQHGSSLGRQVSVPIKHDLRTLLPRIQAPVLLAWGDQDHMFPLEFAHEMASLIKKSKVATVTGGYHEWGLVQPEIFVSLAKAFSQT